MAKEEKKEVVEEVKEIKINPMVKKANEAAERLEAGNKELKELLDRKESLAVEATLSGEAEAGKPAEKVDKDQEEADKLMALTG